MNTKERCDVLLAAVINHKEIEAKWWKSPNLGFNGRMPIECDINEVYEYLLLHFGGE
jgi:hypothetical protein